MMPRIQFSIDAGDGFISGHDETSVPRRVHSSVIRDIFCNPNTNCSPVCCCCGLLDIRIAVKGVVWIALVFSIWEVSMGSWLLIESSCCLTPLIEDERLGIRQLSKLRAAGWLLILVGLSRFMGLVYLLHAVSNEERARRLPTNLCISISILIGLILTYPMFIQIPGKGIILPEGSHLKDFKSAYTMGYTIDLLFMLFYSLYCILYYILLTNHNQQNSNDYCTDGDDVTSRHVRFEPIDANVRLT